MSYFPASKSDKWMTPSDLYKTLDDEFHFDHDPCPITWTPTDPDGLTTNWGSSSFVNPPYSQTAKWIAKSHAEWKRGKTVVMLINAITDTRAFHDYIYGQAELRFIRGRLRFTMPTGKTGPSPRPSMIVIFRAQQSSA